MKNRMTEQTAKKTSPQIHCEIAMSAYGLSLPSFGKASKEITVFVYDITVLKKINISRTVTINRILENNLQTK